MSDRLLTTEDIAALLGVERDTVSSYKSRGQMPAPDQQYGRTPLWKHSTIQSWIKTRGTK